MQCPYLALYVTNPIPKIQRVPPQMERALHITAISQQVSPIVQNHCTLTDDGFFGLGIDLRTTVQSSFVMLLRFIRFSKLCLCSR